MNFWLNICDWSIARLNFKNVLQLCKELKGVTRALVCSHLKSSKLFLCNKVWCFFMYCTPILFKQPKHTNKKRPIKHIAATVPLYVENDVTTSTNNLSQLLP
jgi:hypothetical protein